MTRKIKNRINPDVIAVINTYPEEMRENLFFLRQLILDTASGLSEVDEVEETLKWGEPAYLGLKSGCKTGSTIRLDRLKSNPDQYALYFNCKTTLIDTFKELYPDRFTFAGNRALIFSLDEKIPVDEVRHCISLSLIYHKVKQLPLLGA